MTFVGCDPDSLLTTASDFGAMAEQIEDLAGAIQRTARQLDWTGPDALAYAEQTQSEVGWGVFAVLNMLVGAATTLISNANAQESVSAALAGPEPQRVTPQPVRPPGSNGPIGARPAPPPNPSDGSIGARPAPLPNPSDDAHPVPVGDGEDHVVDHLSGPGGGRRWDPDRREWIEQREVRIVERGGERIVQVFDPERDAWIDATHEPAETSYPINDPRVEGLGPVEGTPIDPQAKFGVEPRVEGLGPFDAIPSDQVLRETGNLRVISRDGEPLIQVWDEDRGDWGPPFRDVSFVEPEQDMWPKFGGENRLMRRFSFPAAAVDFRVEGEGS